MERLPAEHPAASSSPLQGGSVPAGRLRGEPDGPSAPGRGGTMTLQRPTEPPPGGSGGATAVPRPARTPRSRPGLQLRHWKVRSKLAAVLLVPAVAFLVLASINMAGQIGSAQEFGRGATIAEFGRQASTLVYELQGERDRAAGFIAAGRPKSNQAEIDRQIAANAARVKKDDDNDPVQPVEGQNEFLLLGSQQQNVDGALTSYRAADAALGDVGSDAQSRVDAARTQLEGLPSLRTALSSQLLTQGAIDGKYTGMIQALLEINREIGRGTGNTGLNTQVAGLTSLSDLKETLSRERALLYAVLSAQGGARFQFAQQKEFGSVIAEREAALQRFRAAATEEQRTQYDAKVGGQAVLAVQRLEVSVSRSASGNDLSGLDASQWYFATNTYLTAMRQVESGILDQVVGTTRDLRSDAQRQAITTGVVIAAILVIAFLTSLLIARSMIGPLRRLQAGARDVAEVRLPEAIARLQRPDAAAVPDRIEPIGIDSRDEIGQVAKTFDQLHQRAVELASEQAGLRRNVNDMFVNLSRRSQGLVERQLKLIDELETGEQDPDQLANLFKLDHLATRMRRNSENLLVLAGEDAGRRWGRPIPLVDVLRAATSEVEQYHRIQLTGVPDVEVMGHGVNHLVHLVAELLENATVFSSPESKVLVHSQRLSDGGAMVEIEDRGIGMSAHEISDSNERLAHPPEFDVSVSRMMGLYVVGRLATRHGITVRLRQSETGGVSAFVRVPIDVLANRFEQRKDDTAGGPPSMAGGPMSGGPMNDGRSLDGRSRPAALPMSGGPMPPRPLTGPAADLPRRTLGRPDQPAPPAALPPGPATAPTGPGAGPAGPGSKPLPRRTPASAGGSDGATAGGADGIPVNGAPASGIPMGGGRPVLPPTPNGNGYAGNGSGPAEPPQRPPLPMRSPAGGPDGQDGRGPDGRGPDGRGPDGRGPDSRGPDGRGLDGRGQDGRGQDGRGPDGRGPQAPFPMGGPDGAGRIQDQPVRGQDGPRPVPPLGTAPDPYGLTPPAAVPGREESTPIFEQLQSEWFRQRPAAAPRPAAGPNTPATAPQQPPATPVGAPAASAPAQAPAQLPVPPQVPVPEPVAAVGPASDEAWASPADEGWRAAERLLQPSSGGTTRAGLPMRVPQAHLMPGGAGSGDGPSATAPEPPRPAYRSPEAVRSRLASYHQGVRRGRHAERAPDGADGDNGETPSEILVQQSQEQS